MEPKNCLLKANAIRFRWLAKAHIMPLSRKSKNFDADTLAHELLEIYDKINEADRMFEKGLNEKESSKLLALAKGLCYFQQGLILERVIHLYSPRHTQSDLDEHTKNILADFEFAQREFKRAKNMHGVLLSIEHRSLNDTVNQRKYTEYHKMKLDALRKMHP